MKIIQKYTMPPPATPKIYHILHVDRLPSVIADGSLWCDSFIRKRARPGTSIGIKKIKQWRLTKPVKCRPGLNVGDCVPFNFYPRSVMLYVIHKGGSELAYRGGQEPIVHLEADLQKTVTWAEEAGLQWAFTLSNAGGEYFEDRCHLEQLGDINWKAIGYKRWDYTNTKRDKQAEFLVEQSFPRALVQRIGVCTPKTRNRVAKAITAAAHKPALLLMPDWYYSE